MTEGYIRSIIKEANIIFGAIITKDFKPFGARDLS